MNPTKLKLIIGGIVLFFSSLNAVSQNVENENITKDSETQYIIPKKLNADLSLITAPNGFVSAEQFNGYIYTQASAAIIMTMIEEVNYLKICEGMTSDYFAQNKLTKITEGKFTSIEKVKGQYYKCSFVLDGVDYIRIMVFAGDLTKTLWLNITYPTKFEELLEEEIFTTIRSISLNPKKNEAK